MIISLSKKFICLNPPKTGSGFRECVLHPYTDILTLKENDSIPEGMMVGSRHVRVFEAQQYLKYKNLNEDDFFWFTFTRNPWKRMESWYNMLMTRSGNPIVDEDQPKLFEQYVKRSTPRDFCSMDGFMKRNNKPLDFIGTQENLSHDMLELSDKFDLNTTLQDIDRCSNPGKYVIDFKNCWTQELVDLVARANELTLSMKPYKFEGHLN